MPIYYKIDVLAALKEKGYSAYKLRQDKIFGERIIQQIRDAVAFTDRQGNIIERKDGDRKIKLEIVTADNLGTLCKLLQCQPGDIIGYKSEQ